MTKGLGCLAVVVVGVIILALMMMGTYNNLVGLSQATDAQWANVESAYQRRADLIPNLVETVKGAMTFERETLEAVVNARNQAISIEKSGASVPETAAAEARLSGALGRLLAVVEAYPDLKATGNTAQLQEELTATENKISFARQLYNDTATQYNTKQQQFPTSLVAGVAHASPTDLWEIEDQAERAVPQVDLSRR